MTTSRLISSFTIDASNKVLYVSYSGGAPTAVTLTEGTYRWSCDAAAGDFAQELKLRLQAAFGGTTWTVQVTGVNRVDATVCNGRVRIAEAAQNFELMMTHASWTMDHRILGWPGTADEASASKELTSDWVHRYGWYPQSTPVEDVIKVKVISDVAFTSGRYRSGVSWPEYEQIDLAFDCIHSPFARIAAAADATRAAASLVSTADLNCAFERFALDLAGDSDEEWRYYPDATAATYHGPYTFSPDSVLWMDPLGLSLVQERAGELWTITLGGVAAT